MKLSVLCESTMQAVYWIEKLEDARPLNYSYDFYHSGENCEESKAVSNHVLSHQLTASLHSFCATNNVSLFNAVTTVFTVLMMRYTSTEDVLIGTIASPANNPVCLRTNLGPASSFLEALEISSATVKEAFAQSGLSFDRVLSAVKPVTLPGHHPLFSFVLVDEYLDLSTVDTAQYSLVLQYSTLDDGSLQFCAHYNPSLFLGDTILFMLKHMESLIGLWIKNSQANIRSCSFLFPGELVLANSHNTRKSWNLKYLHDFFEEAVNNFPENVALWFNGVEVTYGDLNKRANQLAHWLVFERGVECDEIVCLYFNRGISALVALLAVLKAGAAFCPIDTEAPFDRVQGMLSDTQSRLLLTDGSFSTNYHGCSSVSTLEIVNIVSDTTASDLSKQSNVNLKSSNLHMSPRSLAYVLFTSGTTGKPKGVLIEHQNISSTIIALKEKYPFFSRHLAFASYTFDASIEDVFLCFAQSATLVLVSKNLLLKDPSAVICSHNIDSIIVTPSYLALIDAKRVKSCLRVIEIGGEAFTRPQVIPFIEAGIIVFNGYGPTECAVETTSTEITANSIANNIGAPLNNSFHYILEKDLLPAPFGTIGELVIGGAQVGRGYLNHDELTAAAFIANPFVPGTTMYRTGDLARMHSNGHVEILGRIDHQVKLRGYRIELGEIESVLLKHPGVSVAAVIMREDEPGNQYLAAYLVKSDAKGFEIGASELKAHCASSLLPYMIPTAFVWMEKLPVTVNGKLDKRALPIPEFAVSDHEELVPLEGEIEHLVASVWSQLLNTPLESIGRNSNFFALGGNSLLAARIISKLNSDSRLGQISFSEFMSSQSLQLLCDILAGPSTSLLFPQVVLSEHHGAYSRPASISESRLFVYQQQHPQSIEYNSISYYTISDMSFEDLQQGVSALVSRHEVLRTQYRWVSENIIAFVAESPASDRIAQFPTQENMQQIPNTPFDLCIEPPVRFYAFPDELEGSWTVAAVMHHICYDGTCMPVFERDLRALCTGNTLPPVVSQYGDFAAWENKLKDTGVFEKQQEYWKAKLENATPLSYSFDFHHGGLNHSSKADEVSFVIEGDLSARLNEFAIENCVSRFTVMATLFNILMMRYTGVDDISIGTLAANRQMDEFSETMGFFINNICLRTNLGDSGTFLDAVRATAETVNGGLENQNLPFEQVISCVRAARLPGRHPIFGFILVEQETLDLDENGRSNLVLDPFQMLFQYSADQSGKVVGSIAYDSSLFLRESIERQVHHLKSILGIALSSPSCEFRSVSFVDSEELHVVIHKHNVEKTFAESNSQLLHNIFENAACLHPERIAVEYQSQTLTYRDLNAAANRLANYLAENFGELYDQIVCLFFDRGVERIVAMLAVLKAGGCFCPIDIEAPVDRVSSMISDSNCRIVLSCTSLMRDLASKVLSVDVELLDIERLDVSKYDSISVNISPISSSHLVYCLFTSGTTGKPKGVLLEHRNVFNYISSYNAMFPGTKKHLAFAAYTFDMSVFDAFVAFGQSATLVQAPKVEILTSLTDLIVKKEIDSLSLTPSSLVLIELEAVTNVLKTVSLAGEPFSNAAIQPFLKREISVINIYGPTEAGCTTATQLHPNSISNDIGHPLYNCRHYVLHAKTREPIAYGCTGELFIGGIQVGRGYLNRPELTEKSFVPDPFRPGQRMYKTGDLARMHSNGHVEILGRIDHQVKLRGYRIELGEIESVLLKHPGVSVAAVIMREDEPGNQYLTAYLVKSDAKEFDIGASELKAHCASSLLPYMIPTAFVWMEKLPVTVNGKLDKRALPIPEFAVSDHEEVVPLEGEIEHLVASVWSQLLNTPLESIGRNSNFFALGGNSLLAARIISKLNSDSRLGQISFSEFMSSQSLQLLCDILAGPYTSLLFPQVVLSEHHGAYSRPASISESRLFVYQQQHPQSIEYNSISYYTISDMSFEDLQQGVSALVSRHEVLRTQYRWVSENIIAFVAESPASDRIAQFPTQENMQQIPNTPFDLCIEPPVRFYAFPDELEGSWTVAAVMHHICYDGTCMPVFERDLRALCTGNTLPPVVSQYGDFAAWENQLKDTGVFGKQQEHWKATLENATPLPYSFDFYHSGSEHVSKPAEVSFSFDKELTNKLEEFAAKNCVSRFAVVLAAFNVLMMRYTGSDDICVGTVAANRQMDEFSETMGFFINNVCLRTQLGGAATFGDAVQAASATINEALENQNLPFEEVLSVVRPPRLPGRHPLFGFVILEQESASLAGSRADEADGDNTGNLGPFELLLQYCKSDNGALAGSISYDSALFLGETIKFMAKHIESLLSIVLINECADIRSVPFLFAGEQDLCVNHFNIEQEWPEAEDARLLHKIFEESAAKYPDRIALSYEATEMTYAELNLRANSLAGYLVTVKVVQNDDIVGLFYDRGLESVVATLAVLKAGAAFCPIDTEAPPERVAGMLEDSNCRVVLTDAQHASKLEEHKGISIVDSLRAQSDAPFIPKAQASSTLAYCIFTSGTTGKPKGALIEHRNIWSTFKSLLGIYPQFLRHFAFSAYTFDLSIFDRFIAFGRGSVVVVAKKSDFLDNFNDIIIHKKLDSLAVTPSALSMLDPNQVQSVVKVIMLAGETHSRIVLQPFLNRDIAIWNGYGPSETALGTHHSAITKSTISNNVGIAMLNCYQYILNSKSDAPVPFGCVGELCIGGSQVGRGYLNRPELTEESFVTDPFRPGQRMYKTGDLARMHSNGHVEILGRIDHQVKLRGYRIELGEIESVLLKHPGVSVAAVIMREDEPGNQYLAAYLVKSDAKEFDIGASELKAHCASSLLPYMIPTAFVWMEKLPVTVNGKLDKRRLPVPKRESDLPKDSKLILPRNAVERLVHATWCRIFGMDKISIVDDFFDDLGGHSLLAARIINALRSSSPEYSQLSIADIMTNGRSIEHLAKRLDSFSSAEHLEQIDRVEVDDCGNMTSLPEGINPSLFLMLQMLGIMVHLGLLGSCAFAAIWVSTTLPPLLNGAYSLFVSPISAVVFGLSYLLCTILLKWSLLQVVTPGDYPIRGSFHLRWWMANLSFQIAKTLLLPFLRESQLFNMYLRALGFKVGKGTIIDTVHLTGFDCVEIGDFSFVGDDSTVLAHQFEVDRIRLVKTTIGNKCITGVRSMVNPGVIMQDEGFLGPMSSAFGILNKGEAYNGSPAVSTGPAEKVEMDPGIITRTIIGLYQPLCLLVVVFLAFTAQIPGSLLFSLLPHETNAYIEIVFGATVLGYLYSIMYALQVVVLKWLLVQQSKEGEFQLGIFYRMRRYLFDRLVVNFLHHTITGAAFQGSILLPLYLRLLGSKINWKVWLADIGIRTGVDLLTVEEGVVMGGENLVYSHNVMGNKISFKKVLIETHSNTGNSVVVLPGSRIGRNTLIGDLALVQGELSERSVWIGSPCIRIQQLDDSRLDIKKRNAVTTLQQYAQHTRITEDASATTDLLETPAVVDVINVESNNLLPGTPATVENTIFNSNQEPEDSNWRTVLRELWILILKFTMFFPEMITILIFTWSHNLFLTWFGTTAGMWLIPANAILCIFAVILCIWFVKRVFIGKFIGSTSVFSFKFLVWTTYGSIYAILGNVFLFIQGTALLPAFLRLMGSKIGKNVYMEGIPPIETDQLEIGDDAIVMDRVVLQPHVIDHATLQFARIYIGKGVVMEPKSSLQALSTLSKGSKLKALSFVMKGETIPEDTVWAGNPSKFVGERKKVASTRLSDSTEEGWMQSRV
ncbi:hypothetical protein BDR26DRAFT_697506 [Obelidium mucronatum]|nr:hypothetical protein BDR26DRAFT_697506 [Obelidium mucronatum]